MSIWLARLAIDRWRHEAGCAEGEGADAEPHALIAEAAHGLRIEAANDAGLAAGARPGMKLTDARALCPELKVSPSDPAGDAAFLEKLALWAQRWGPWSALDPPDGLLVDVTGVAHLFGGEAQLLADAQGLFTRRGIRIRLAIAPTAGAAWALAHYGPDKAILAPSSSLAPPSSPALSSSLRGAKPRGNPGLHEGGWIAAPPSAARNDEECIAEALADLPVAALRLDGEVLTVLRRLGLKRIGQLGGVGRDAVQRRFRNRRSPEANPLLRMDQLLGRVPEPLLPIVAVPAPLVQRRLLEPIRHRELLDRVVADLAADMVRELERRAEGARWLELGLWRVDGDVAVRRLEFAAATRDATHVSRLFGGKLDDVDAGFGIETVRLQASWTEPLPLAQGDFEAATEEQGTSLAMCIDRLTVRLGEKAVRRPVPQASHIPERAQRWQPPLEQQKTSQGEFAFHGRPLKLLDKPEKISVLYATPDGFPRSFRWRGAVHDIARVEGPERIAPEWWREKAGARLRDYYRIEDREGRRYWIYRQGIIGDGRGGLPDWFLQGLCG